MEDSGNGPNGRAKGGGPNRCCSNGNCQSMTAETIVAIATAIVPQQGSVGIVRLSGSAAIAIARKLFRAPGQQPWESHRILYGHIYDPQNNNLVDEALLLLMRAPRSYTREDVVELHCHGGLIVVQQVLNLCISQGARLAQPGEFSLRAFLNGRIDLTQAESVTDLVSAQSPRAAALALAGLQGKLAQPIRELQATCLDILSEIEARVDFEDDLPALDEAVIKAQLDAVLGQVQRILATADQGQLLRAGIKVAIVGRPNVGKSSLLNAWSRSDRAIVTDLPGTTRDLVESQLVVAGIPVQVLDTAGIRETADPVEARGVARSRSAAQGADLILFVVDATVGYSPEDAAIYAEIVSLNRPVICIQNKIDLLPTASPALPEIPEPCAIAVVPMAAAQGQGIDALEQAILAAIQLDQLQAANLDLAINQRQAAALTQAAVALEQVQATIAAQLPFDFWTIDLRSAIRALNEITGEGVTESVLERIFSRFCIGK